MTRWLADQTNLVLLVAIGTTIFGLVVTTINPQNGPILAFAGTLWMVWATVLKERRRRGNGDDDDSDS